jgi:hypothetical protein
VSSGILQGDPALSLFFALVLVCPEAAAAVLKDDLLFANVDDVTIAGPAEQVAAAFQAFESVLVEPGLAISSICALDFPNLSILPQQLQKLTVTRCNHCSWYADRRSNLLEEHLHGKSRPDCGARRADSNPAVQASPVHSLPRLSQRGNDPSFSHRSTLQLL